MDRAAIEILVGIANSAFVDWSNVPNKGLDRAVALMKEQTDNWDEIKTALLQSHYGADETLNLFGILSLL